MLIGSQVIRPPLDAAPPVGIAHPCALGEVHLLRRERMLECALLTVVSSVAMEGGASKLGSRLLDHLDRVLAAMVPVVVVRDDSRASEPVAVHQRSQRPSDVRFLCRSEFAGGVCRVTVLGLILDPNRVGGDALAPEPLQRLQEVNRI